MNGNLVEDTERIRLNATFLVLAAEIDGIPREPTSILHAVGTHWTWAALMRRAFVIDVLACPRCGGRLRVIATVEDPVAVRPILAARRPAETLGPGPPAPAEAPAFTA